MQAEEDERRRDEVKKHEERNRQLAEERKQVEKQIHDTYISSATPNSPTLTQLDYKTYAQQSKKGNLVSGRAHMFDQKASELAATATKPTAKPKNFKYEIKTAKPVGVPVNRDENGQTTHTKAYNSNVGNRDKPVFAKIATPTAFENTQDNEQHRKYPPFSGVKLPSPVSPPVVPIVKANHHEEAHRTPSNEVPFILKSTKRHNLVSCSREVDFQTR